MFSSEWLFTTQTVKISDSLSIAVYSMYTHKYLINTDKHTMYAHNVFIQIEARAFISYKRILTWCLYELFLYFI